jgi:Cu-Zn family superoxide dismutase
MKTLCAAFAGAVLAAGLSLASAGCGSTGTAPEAAPAPAKAPGAVAVLEAKSGSKLEGTATFEHMEGSRISCRIELRNVTPGVHAAHIHEKGDCSDPAGKSAGGHWNPTTKKHGQWNQADGEFHLGDLGNIEVGADGTGSLTVTCDLWTIGDGGPYDIVGRSVIVHAAPDDFKTQPTGNAGDRIGCGPIALAK